MDRDSIIGAVALGAVILAVLLPLLWLAVRLFKHALAIAVELFEWAAEHGFIGFALYVILWVIATPVMAVICIVGGMIRMGDERSSSRASKAINPATPPKAGTPEYLDWASKRGKSADDQPERTS